MTWNLLLVLAAIGVWFLVGIATGIALSIWLLRRYADFTALENNAPADVEPSDAVLDRITTRVMGRVHAELFFECDDQERVTH